MTTVCWQYLVKMQQKNLGFDLTIETQKTGAVSIAELDWHQAKDFILQYEWLGNMGTSKRCFGLSIDDRLASVVCYGPPVAPSRYKRLLGPEFSKCVVQLCRGATTFWAPKWAASKLISGSMNILRGTLDVLIVVAYADPEAGELGIIYQACNAYYLGRTDIGGAKRYVIHGHSYDPRKVNKKFGSRSQEKLSLIDPEFSTIPIMPKHRYMIVRGTKSKRRQVYERIRPFVMHEWPRRTRVE